MVFLEIAGTILMFILKDWDCAQNNYKPLLSEPFLKALKIVLVNIAHFTPYEHNGTALLPFFEVYIHLQNYLPHLAPT